MRKRCRFCGESFRPNPRTRSFQFACSKAPCQKARKQASQRRWVAANPDCFRDRYFKKKTWHAEHPGYLAAHRKKHPEAARKHREAERGRRRRRVQERVDIQDAIRTQEAIHKEVAPLLPSTGLVDIQDAICVQASILLGVMKPNPASGSVDRQDGMASPTLDAYNRHCRTHTAAFQARRQADDPEKAVGS